MCVKASFSLATESCGHACSRVRSPTEQGVGTIRTFPFSPHSAYHGDSATYDMMKIRFSESETHAEEYWLLYSFAI